MSSVIAPASGVPAARRLALDAVSSRSPVMYGKAPDDFSVWRAGQGPPFVRATVQAHRTSRSALSVHVDKAEPLDHQPTFSDSEAGKGGCAQWRAAPEVTDDVIQVLGAKQYGMRVGIWLTRDHPCWRCWLAAH